MKREKHYFFKMIMVTLLYYFLGLLCFYLSIHSNNVTPLWPPAGIALIVLIIGGIGLFPSIFIGAFIVNFHYYVMRGDYHLSSIIVASTFLGIGSLMQALLGFYLYKKTGLKEDGIHHPIELLLLCYVVAPISCLISATVGNLTLFILGILKADQFIHTWFSWFIGDYMGIVLICGIGMVGISQVKKGHQKILNLKLSTFGTLLAIISLSFGLMFSFISSQDQKEYIVGISKWGDNDEYEKNIEAFKAALNKNGFIEGKNIKYLVASPHAKKDVVEGIIKDFLLKKADLLFVQTTPATLVAKSITQTVPIVFSIVTFPVENKVIDSMKSSLNNVVGSRNYIPMKRQLDIFKKVFKNPQKIGFVHRKNEPNSTYQLNELQEIAKQEGFEVIEIPATSVDDVTSLLEEKREKIDSLFSACDTLVQTGVEDKVIAFAKKYGLPDFSCLTSGVKKGSLIGNVADVVTIGEKSGEMAAKILKGKKTFDLESYAPENDTILLNLKRSEELKLEVPLDFIDQVSEVIR